jgi:hypothetical protein
MDSTNPTPWYWTAALTLLVGIILFCLSNFLLRYHEKSKRKINPPPPPPPSEPLMFDMEGLAKRFVGKPRPPEISNEEYFKEFRAGIQEKLHEFTSLTSKFPTHMMKTFFASIPSEDGSQAECVIELKKLKKRDPGKLVTIPHPVDGGEPQSVWTPGLVTDGWTWVVKCLINGKVVHKTFFLGDGQLVKGIGDVQARFNEIINDRMEAHKSIDQKLLDRGFTFVVTATQE